MVSAWPSDVFGKPGSSARASDLCTMHWLDKRMAIEACIRQRRSYVERAAAERAVAQFDSAFADCREATLLNASRVGDPDASCSECRDTPCAEFEDGDCARRVHGRALREGPSKPTIRVFWIAQ